MLVTRNGLRVGTISGGCLEAEIARRIWWLTERGACVKRYTTSLDDDAPVSYGLGCGGAIYLLLERCSAGGLVCHALGRVLSERRPYVLLSAIRTTHPKIPVGAHFSSTDSRQSSTQEFPACFAWKLVSMCEAISERSRHLSKTLVHEEHEIEVFGEHICPPVGLVIFGSGDDIRPLVAIAKTLGWYVTVVETRKPSPPIDRFPNANVVVSLSTEGPIKDQIALASYDAVVLMTHSYEQDERLLRELTRLKLPYLGVLGPRTRTARILGSIGLENASTDSEALPNLHSPVGIPLGGDGAAAIALSIAAEIQAVFGQYQRLSLGLTSMVATAELPRADGVGGISLSH
jgi:xanthine dehydrogenase accessory factor